MDRVHNNQPLIPPKQNNYLQSNQESNNGNNNFKDLLENNLEQANLSFSKHAKRRINARGINFQGQDLTQLKEGVAKAKEKGGQESLIMVNDNAYIVSVENETVITAMGEDEIEENVFTNIDSAVIMK